jgi:carboxyl-terminal processing protease
MTSKRRDLLTIVMIVLLAALSFGAGFLVNELVEIRRDGGFSTVAGNDFTVFWEAWEHIEDSFIGEIPAGKAITYGAARGSMSVLDDPYTLFVEPAAREQERERLRGFFDGVGVELSRNEDGKLVMVPIPGNPAEEAGILSGDILVAVDGIELTEETTIEEIAQLVRGEEGTKVILTVIHPGSNQPTDIPVIRAAILLPSVTHRILADDEAIGYIRLSRFTGESGSEVEQAIVNLKEAGATSLILDLRQNGGGLRDAAIEVSDHFLDSGMVVIQLSKEADEQEFFATAGETAGGMPLVILVDESTASAAEIVAGALQDHQRATLIGLPTFGKGSVQLVFDLSDGSSVHVTSAKWLTPNRNQLDQQGLQPEIEVEITQEAIDLGRDEILERAITYLGQQ